MPDQEARRVQPGERRLPENLHDLGTHLLIKCRLFELAVLNQRACDLGIVNWFVKNIVPFSFWCRLLLFKNG